MKKKKKPNVAIILILLLVLLLLSPRPMQTAVMGGGSVTFTDNYNAHIIASSSECLGNPKGSVAISFEYNDANQISDWIVVEGTGKFQYSGGEFSSCGFLVRDDRIELTSGYIGDGVFCSWSAEVDIRDPNPVTTTIPDGECSSDSDCFWCGDVCRKWEPDLGCIMIAPPEGYSCECVYSECKAVPKEPFPVIALLLIGGLALIIIKGKKWLK